MLGGHRIAKGLGALNEEFMRIRHLHDHRAGSRNVGGIVDKGWAPALSSAHTIRFLLDSTGLRVESRNDARAIHKSYRLYAILVITRNAQRQKPCALGQDPANSFRDREAIYVGLAIID